MAFMSVMMPYPGSTLYSANVTRFHLAKEWTTSAWASFMSLMGKVTGRSTPFRSSFIPNPLSTNKGAVTLRKRSSVDILLRKKSFIFLMAISVCCKSNSA
jgi:hypothetical protein